MKHKGYKYRLLLLIIFFIKIVMAPKSETQRFTFDNNKDLTAVLDKYPETGPVYNVWLQKG